MKRIIFTGILLFTPQIAPAEKPLVITNETMENYQPAPETLNVAPYSAPAAPQRATSSGRARKAATPSSAAEGSSGSRGDYSYYCQQATAYRRDIANAQTEIEASKTRTVKQQVYVPARIYGDTVVPGHYATEEFGDAAGHLNAKRKLETLQQSLARLEESARTNNIPAGWLRCSK